MAEARPMLRLAAPAKVNLWLTVTGRRADGFHELDSALVLLDLGDEMQLSDAGVGIVVDGPMATRSPTDESNLAVRGLLAGLGHSPDGSPAPASPGIHLNKLIPVAAGLGGGSSDAAAGWRLARRWVGGDDAPAAPPERETLARIGADVPFFAAQLQCARVGGIGEVVVPAPSPNGEEVVLVHPGFGLSTAAVFGALEARDWSGPMPPDAPEGEWRNDLERPARRLRPELDDVFRLVERAGGQPRLTGSGPTVYVLTDDPERADGVTRRVTAARVATTRTRVRSGPASIEIVEQPEPAPR